MEPTELPEEEKSALDTVEHELYDPHKQAEDIMISRPRESRPLDLPSSWSSENYLKEEMEKEKRVSFGVKMLVFSSIILLLAISFTAWRVFSSRNVVSSANIDMTADITPYVEGGEEIPLVVTLGNKNTSALQDATLTLLYKKGTGSQNEEEKISEKRIIGNIGANEYKRQDFKVTVYGAEAESRDLAVKLEYKVAGSNAIFNKVVTQSVTLKTPPMSVHIDGPSTLSHGQSGTFIVTVKNNTGTSSLPSVLQLTLPNTFNIESSEPEAISRSASWAIPPLTKGGSTVIKITGSISGSQKETTSIQAKIGSQGDSFNRIGVVYSTQSFDLNVVSSPITFALALSTDRGSSESLRYGDRATLSITYTNNSDTPIQDVSFKVAISGTAALTKEVIPGDGYYDSEAQTITWNKTILSELATVDSKAQGTFSIIIPIVSQGSNSPILKVEVTGVGSSVNKDDVLATISKTWAVQGSVNISAQTNYKNSQFKNTGPVPPEPNTDTTYTEHIIVSAQNALNRAKVTFSLPLYVSWLNTTSNNSNILYDDKNRTVTWNIDKMEAGKTVTADVRVSVRPSQSHVGLSPAITSKIVLDADEEVSKAHIRTTISPLTTIISGENWSVDPSVVVDGR